MPSVADLHLPASPLEDPLSYPGATLDANFLWLDPWLYDLSPVTGAGSGEWAIRVDGGPLTRSDPRRLDDALADVGAPGLLDRQPVMAFGSNCAPAQLLDKFASLGSRHQVVPVLRGVVSGLRLSHSPHVSPPGYVPYVLVRSAREVELRIFVLMLDPIQLLALNRTEPNYRLDIVDGFPITVETGDVIVRYHAYRGRWGALRLAGAVRPVGPHTQQQVFDMLCATDWFTDLTGAGDVGQLVSRLAGDPELRAAVRRELGDRGLVVSDGLDATPAVRQ